MNGYLSIIGSTARSSIPIPIAYTCLQETFIDGTIVEPFLIEILYITEHL